MKNFNPDWLSPPCDTILDILYDKDWNTIDFAIRMDISYADAIGILTNDIRIDSRIAEKLSITIGSSMTFWLRREEHYIISMENK